MTSGQIAIVYKTTSPFERRVKDVDDTKVGGRSKMLSELLATLEVSEMAVASQTPKQPY
jgi:hypothetical protein